MPNRILPTQAKKIISLVPSQTELLFYLGLEEEVVGITKFCIHPPQWFQQKKRVGGTKNIHIDTIHTLQPDLVLANKEENNKQQIELVQQNYPVWVSDIQTLPNALHMIETIGTLVHREEEAFRLCEKILYEKEKFAIQTKQKALYLIWREPYMAAGADTFIQDMMSYAGFENCLTQTRYPVLSIEEIKQLKPSIILLSSEPYPFKEKHILELQHHLPTCTICLVDGELFSWYGSRLLHSFSYFATLHEQLA
jgi:ABC-type Fe3+-hydroxamate transport system substrate-binding protein